MSLPPASGGIDLQFPSREPELLERAGLGTRSGFHVLCLLLLAIHTTLRPLHYYYCAYIPRRPAAFSGATDAFKRHRDNAHTNDPQHHSRSRNDHHAQNPTPVSTRAVPLQSDPLPPHSIDPRHTRIRAPEALRRRPHAHLTPSLLPQLRLLLPHARAIRARSTGWTT